MFCPSCGTESTGLNYCNRCGANLSAPTSPPEIVQLSLTKPAAFLGVLMTFITLGGFAFLIGGARALASVVIGSDPLIAMIFMGMLVILVVDIFLARQLTKLINAALSPGRRSTEKTASQPPNTFRLPHPDTARLEPGASVTENTTRFFEGYPAASAPERVPVKETKLT